MDNSHFFGQLNSLPWPRLLAQLWQKKKSGCLELRLEKETFRFWLSRGNMLVIADSLPLCFWSDFLQVQRRLDPQLLHQTFDQVREKGWPLLRCLIDYAGLSPEEAWDCLVKGWKEWFYDFFDLTNGQYTLEPMTPEDSLVYAELPTPELILEGIRRMKNLNLIEAHLPEAHYILQVNSNSQLTTLSLTPVEKYIIRLLGTGLSLNEFYSRCHLSRQECQRTLFALLSLELVNPVAASAFSKKSASPTLTQLDNVLASFNEKCAFIFRFVSKEIGPVAWNVLEKALEEIRPHLSTPLAKATLQEDGRFDLPEANRLVWQFLNDPFRQAILRDLNEILMAEVLAVKRTLGPELERTLVQSLEKIGEG